MVFYMSDNPWGTIPEEVLQRRAPELCTTPRLPFPEKPVALMASVIVIILQLFELIIKVHLLC